MTRPRYEQPGDRANEYAALARFGARYNVLIGPRIAETGFTVLQDNSGRPVAYVEVKCRTHNAFKFETLNLSYRKVDHAKRIWQREQLPTLLLVRFTDRVMVTKLHPRKKDLRTRIWGRDDRGDPEDMELCVEITMGKFTEVL